MATQSPERQASELRAWAAEGEPAHVRAAVDLLLKEGWPRRGDFQRECLIRRGGVLTIGWVEARALHASAPRGSSTELAILDLAVTLAEDRFHLQSMGRVHRQWIADAVRQAVGLQ